MNKEDIKNLVIFVLLIVAILGLVIYNISKKNKIPEEDIDRKVIYINNLSYEEVEEQGNKVFFDVMNVLVNNKFDYELTPKNRVKIYSIDGIDYKRITNISTIVTKLSSDEKSKFLEYKNIINYNNGYYILDNVEEKKYSYIGSMLSIDSYTDDYVIFKSKNYYNENISYIGNIEDELNCECNLEESTFKLIFENNNLVIDDIYSLINILK